MTRLWRVPALVCAMFVCLTAWAEPGADASAVVERWSAAYSANDVDALVSLYAPDALLLGTVSPIKSEGTAAIRTYFGRLKGSGNKNTVREQRVFVLGDNAALVAGFYDFSNPQQSTVRPSRFTLLVTRQGSEWRIAHHHSSPLVPPPN